MPINSNDFTASNHLHHLARLNPLSSIMLVGKEISLRPDPKMRMTQKRNRKRMKRN